VAEGDFDAVNPNLVRDAWMQRVTKRSRWVMTDRAPARSAFGND